MIHKLVFSRSGALLGVLASLTAVGFVLPSTAAAKVTGLTSCQGITAPGKYRLDADVTAAPFADCFDISASNVTLNLNGHMITAGELGRAGILVESGATSANIVGPGTITGWMVEAILLNGDNGKVRGVTATANTDGIDFQSSGNSIRGNVATDNQNLGIADFEGATGNTIIGNTALGNGADDLFDGNANCDSNVWSGNDFGTANQSCIH